MDPSELARIRSMAEAKKTPSAAQYTPRPDDVAGQFYGSTRNTVFDETPDNIMSEVNRLSAKGINPQTIANTLQSRGVSQQSLMDIYGSQYGNEINNAYGGYALNQPTASKTVQPTAQPSTVQPVPGQPAPVQPMNQAPVQPASVQPATQPTSGWGGAGGGGGGGGAGGGGGGGGTDWYGLANQWSSYGMADQDIANTFQQMGLDQPTAHQLFPDKFDVISSAWNPTDPLGMQRKATNEGIARLNELQTYGQTNVQPYIDAGRTALQDIYDLSVNPAGQDRIDAISAMNPNISVDYESIQNDPMYQFSQGAAQEAARRSLASQGMLNSRFGADALADTAMRGAIAERDNVYNRNVDNYNRELGQLGALYGMETGQQKDQYGQLYNIANMGQNTSLNSANIARGFGSDYIDLVTGLGNASANQMLAQSAQNAQIDLANDQMDNQFLNNLIATIGKWAGGQ